MSFLHAIASWAGPVGWELVAWRAPVGIAVTAAFAIAARLMRAVSLGGAIAGALVTFLLWIAYPGLFVVEVAVFALTAAATRAGYLRKQQLGTAERREGRRASQVLANLSVAAAAALVATFGHQPLLMVGCAAALAEAAADTVSSELGQALGNPPVLITTFRPVPVGSNGGITILGSSAGIVAALLISGVAVLVYVIPPEALLIVLLAGSAGMFFDSLLGATIERAHLFDNDHVNFSSTLFAVAIAIVLARLW